MDYIFCEESSQYGYQENLKNRFGLFMGINGIKNYNAQLKHLDARVVVTWNYTRFTWNSRGILSLTGGDSPEKKL